MAVVTREPVTPSPIENATVVKLFSDGVHRRYEITPNDGYALHDQVRDWTETDPETLEEIVVRGYTTGTASCAASYDFTANPREFYAVPADSVPADQIFGGGDNDHEVM
jgi:hypothetical protein